MCSSSMFPRGTLSTSVQVLTSNDGETVSKESDREAAINELVQQELIAEGRDALQALDKKEKGKGSSSGGNRGGSTNDIDNSPGGPN